MLNKALIVDDHSSVNNGVVQALLEETNISEIEHTQYCDDAHLKFQKALFEKKPYDLLITDLLFEEDHREEKLKGGLDLVETLRAKQPDLKVIVFSVESRPTKIKNLVDRYYLNGFVSKGRNGLKNLLKAINNVNNNGHFIHNQGGIDLKKKGVFEIDEYDIMLLKQLSIGSTQDQIARHLLKKGIKPNSLSSVEKKINGLKIHFKASNTVHLIAKVKDLGLI